MYTLKYEKGRKKNLPTTPAKNSLLFVHPQGFEPWTTPARDGSLFIFSKILFQCIVIRLLLKIIREVT